MHTPAVFRTRSARGVASRPRNVLLACVGLCLVLGVAPQPARAADTAWNDAGLGLLSVASSLFYSPVKVIYATAGSLTAGLAYALSGGQRDLSKILLARSIGGDYVVTPEHLRGDRRLTFVGPDPEPEPYPY